MEKYKFFIKKIPKAYHISIHNMQPNMLRILEKIHVGSETGFGYGSETN
jgi:hypothetical protein